MKQNESESKRTGILFICMGNICRSPLAEGVFRHKIAARGIADRFEVDSAGTGGWHAGDPPDMRMRRVASGHGIDLESVARQVQSSDFERFDYLLCADEENRSDLLRMGAPEEKIQLILGFGSGDEAREVPDPYYGGEEGFEEVFRLVDAACDGLIEHLIGEAVPTGADRGPGEP